MYLFQSTVRSLLIGYLAIFIWTRETSCTNDSDLQGPAEKSTILRYGLDRTDSKNSTEVFSGKVYLLVTGASRGIGKQIAKTFSQLLNENSKVLLVARNPKTLQQAAEDLPKNLDVSYASVDLGNTSTAELEGIIRESLKNDNSESFDRAIIVHSAAKLMKGRTADITDFAEWHETFELNMFSAAVLNNIFIKTFSQKSTKKYVINLSTYWVYTADVQLGTSCPARAAKDMYFKVVALENLEVNVLNYLPGYVMTDMLHEALEMSKGEVLKDLSKDKLENKKFITPVQTANCLAEVLKKQNYKSGGYVDYFDSPAECNNI